MYICTQELNISLVAITMSLTVAIQTEEEELLLMQ